MQNNHKIPGMAELEAKQEDILKQLAELKKQILSIKSDLKISSISSIKPTSNYSSSTCPKVVSVHNIKYIMPIFRF